MRAAFCLVGLLLVSEFPVHSQEQAIRDVGEALPPGALERLGSPHFRVTGPVFGARFVDRGKKLLVRVHHQPQSSFDFGKGDFHIFDMNSGLEQSRLPWELNVILGHWGSTGPIRDFIAFPHWSLSPNAALLATVDHWTLGVREVATGKSVLDVRHDNLDFAFVQFTPDGKRVAAVAARRDAPDKKEPQLLVVIRMWDLATRKEVQKFVPPVGTTETFQAHWFMFSPDGAFLAATGYEDRKAGVVRIWDTAGKNLSWRLPGQTAKRDQARAIAISPNSQTLAAMHDGRIKLWDLGSRKQVKDLAEFKSRCATLDFSPDGKMLIAGVGKEAGERLRLWNLASGEEIVLPLQQSPAYVFSCDGQSLILADTDNDKLTVCDPATGKVRQSFRVGAPLSSREQLEHAFYKARQGMGWPFALTPDGKTLVACDQPGQLRRFDVATGTEIPGPGPRMAPATALAFAPDGKKLLAAGMGKVVLHDLGGKTSPLELQLPTKAARNNSKEKSNPDHVAVSSDGKRIAGGWDDGVVCLWNADTGKLLWQTDGHELGVSSLAFVHGDNELATTGSYDGSMHWWNVADGKRKNTFAVDADKPLFNRRQLWAAPAHWSAFCVDDRRWQEYELATRQVRRELAIDGPMEALSPDGRFFVTAGECCYNLIEQSSGKSLRIFAWVDVERTYYNPGCRVRFSPDRRMIAGVAGKDVVRAWERDSGTVLAALAGHHGGAVAVAFAPDGKRIATSAGDGTILFWKTPPDPGPVATVPLPVAPKIIAGAKDSEGVPLPDGAKARFGLLHFQHGAPVDALRWKPDGKSILVQTTSPEKGVIWIDLWLWDAATGKLQRQIEVTREYHSGGTGIPHVDYWEVSEDAKYLLTWNTFLGRAVPRLSPLRVRDINTGKVVFERADPDGKGRSAQFAPDSKTLLDIYGMEFIDIATGKVQKLQPGDTQIKPANAHLSPDGRLLLVRGFEGAPELWRLGQPGKVIRMPHRLDYFANPAFAPDSRQLALVTATERDKKSHVILVDTASGKTARDLGEFKAETLRYSPDGKQLGAVVLKAAWDWDAKAGWQPSQETVRRWDLGTGKELPPLKTRGGVAVRFSPDGRTLAIVNGESIQLLDAATSRELHRIQVAVPLATRPPEFIPLQHYIGDCLAFSPNGKTLAVAVGRTVCQIDVATGNEIGPTPLSQTLFSVSAAKDGRWLAACTLRHVDLWDGAKKTPAFRVEPWSAADKRRVSFTGAVLSADGARLAVAGSDGTIGLFETPSGKKLSQLLFHTAPVTSLVFAPDAATLVSADISGKTAAWNLASGARLRAHTLPGPWAKGPWQVIADTDGEPIIKDGHGSNHARCSWPALTANAGSLMIRQGEGIRVCNLETRKVRTLQKATNSWQAAAITTDGRLLAVPDQVPRPNVDEPLVRLLDVGSGKELRSAATALDVAHCCFSPDNNWLAVCGDRGISIWHTATGTLMTSLQGHRGKVTTVAFSPDGGTLVSAGFDGTLLAWDVATLLAKSGPSPEPSSRELDALWNNLAGSDGAKAYRVIGTMAAASRTVAYMGQRLRPVAPADPAQLTRLIAELDSPRFSVRENAAEELVRLGDLAEPALQKARKASPALEFQRRVEILLRRLEEPVTSPETLRSLRALEVLERIGTRESRQLLITVSTGSPPSRITQGAQAALQRLPR